MFLTIIPGIWNTKNSLFTGHLSAAEQIKLQSKMGKKKPPTRVSDKDWWVPTCYILEKFIQQSQKSAKSLKLNTQSCVKCLLKFLVKAICFTKQAVHRCKVLFLAAGV